MLDSSSAWIAAAGALGGGLNALLSDNRLLLPKILTAGGLRIVRPGLLVNILVGAIGASALYGSTVTAAASSVHLMVLVPAMLTVGAIIARWISSEADKRLLRAAVVQAATAPAAHPKTIDAVKTAPPYAVLKITDETLPAPRPVRGRH